MAGMSLLSRNHSAASAGSSAPVTVAVIGAGPAGLSAAFRLASSGAKVTVFEAGVSVGGTARSFDLWGQRVDVGPHRFFSKDPRVNRFWLEIMGRDYRMVDRQTRILYRRRLYDYPLRASNALANMGFARAAACVASYAASRLSASCRRSEARTFEDWVVERFGRRLYEMFFKSYSEKLWGISCQELSADFAAQRIKSFSLSQALVAMIGQGGRKHRTLADVFAYPMNGNGELYDRMANGVVAMGGEVMTSSVVRQIVLEDGLARRIRLSDGAEIGPFDHVVSTMPLDVMVRGLPDLPDDVARAAGALRYRNTLIVYLRIDRASLFPDQWLYVHSPELATGRITNFRNWAPEICRDRPETILALEYWCNDPDPDWVAADEALVERAKREIVATGLVAEADIRDGIVLRVPRCYPVYDRDYRSNLEPVVAFLKRHRNIWPIGRYGSFKYNNQDHSILMGLLAAENILGHGTHDLWEINADDAYQESSIITADGLVMEGSEREPSP
jgi:protoporphyrinogen oxidase